MVQSRRVRGININFNLLYLSRMSLVCKLEWNVEK